MPEFENAMNQLAPGKISDPLVSRFGVHLIQVEERRQNQLTMAEQRELARNALREKKLNKILQTGCVTCAAMPTLNTVNRHYKTLL